MMRDSLKAFMAATDWKLPNDKALMLARYKALRAMPELGGKAWRTRAGRALLDRWIAELSA